MSKRRDLTVAEKLKILREYDELPKVSQRSAAIQLKVSQPLLCKLLKSRNEIECISASNGNVDRKRKRTGKDEEVEEALKEWFLKVRKKDASIDGPLFREQAEKLARKMGKTDFVATSGWFQRWKERENLTFGKVHGEQADADKSGAEAWFKNEWPPLCEKYAPSSIFNADETGLYFRALPENTYMFKRENIKGAKISKERITLLCCASMTGEKKGLVAIGKSKRPRCFQGVKKLPLRYFSNKNAWMTASIFTDWLKEWDSELDHDILLLVDNCTAHIDTVPLNHITVRFLPANTTSLIQPCDQGIIKAFKAHYRSSMRRRILNLMEEDASSCSAATIAKKTTLLDALHMAVSAWNRVTDITVRNCFQKGGFSLNPMEDDSDILDELQSDSGLPPQKYDEWMKIDDDIPTATALTEDDIIASVLHKDETESSESDSEDEHEAPKIPPSKSEMLQALDVLREGVQFRATDFSIHYTYENFVLNLFKNARQSRINEFFE